ncbi:MAG TPA: O-antigen ligase family protein [Candidatus Acidoferrum sp.]|nr:O-antigen ligase family protein [Candidatus Acidoferrum sp.]
MPSLSTISATTIRTFGHHLSFSRSIFAELLAQTTVISLICMSLVAPHFVLGGDVLWFKAEVVALPLVLLVYVWLLLAGLVGTIRFNGLFLVGALYSISVAVSIWHGSFLLGQAVIFRDFYEFPKLWLPVIFFTIAYEAKLSEAGLRRLLTYFGAALVLVCLYAWAQWAGLSFSQWLNNLFSAGEHVQGSLQYARRVYSTMGNPNLLGQLMTWSITVFLLAIWLHVGSQARNIFLAVACLITLAMTGSRYGLLDTALAFVLAVAVSFGSSRRRLSRLALPPLLFPLFAAAIFFVSSSNQRTLQRFQTLQNPLTTDSFRQRVDDTWLAAADSFYQSPWLGRGPARTTFEGLITDSEFLDVLKKFGVMGFLFYLGYFFVPLWLIRRGMRAAKRAGPDLENRLPASFLVMRLAFIMILTALVMNIGMSTFYNLLTQGFLWMWMGLGARSAKSIADASQEYFLPFQAGAR